MSNPLTALHIITPNCDAMEVINSSRGAQSQQELCLGDGFEMFQFVSIVDAIRTESGITVAPSMSLKSQKLIRSSGLCSIQTPSHIRLL